MEWLRYVWWVGKCLGRLGRVGEGLGRIGEGWGGLRGFGQILVAWSIGTENASKTWFQTSKLDHANAPIEFNER